jgi:hypothetical protein
MYNVTLFLIGAHGWIDDTRVWMPGGSAAPIAPCLFSRFIRRAAVATFWFTFLGRRVEHATARCVAASFLAAGAAAGDVVALAWSGAYCDEARTLCARFEPGGRLLNFLTCFRRDC